ncbi:MAG TPA: lipopolysaccharide heptosyltransferase II [Candidatus Omnitrophota bacterium]|nr:lipopolysaccharide heptosyltransferase II [Candidatus Omnitrophota bacterium]HPS19560.1 lipopolysaccharide heptosyltransferase II [Candidatus Omnitrophota bacterium]
MLNDPKKIVLIRTDRIGEVLLSSVAINCVKSDCPGAAVTFVTSAYSKDLIDGREDVDEVLIVDTFMSKGWIVRAIKLAVELRRRHFDLAVVMNAHKMLHLAVFLAGIPLRVGYGRKWGFLLNKTIEDSRDKGEKHEIEYTMDLMNAVGINVPPVAPCLTVKKEKKKKVEEMLRNSGIDMMAPIIAVHPSSSNPGKLWPWKKYAELIKMIKSEMKADVVIIGDRESALLADDIIAMSGVRSVGNFCGKMDLKELAAFLSMCALFVGNDTGPMHMAAAAGIPVIAIFGRNVPGVGPKRWRPWGVRHVVFHEEHECAICLDGDCPFDHRCLADIQTEKVFEAVKDILNKK